MSTTLKDISVNVFMELARDTELSSLLEIPSSKMSDIKEQIIEDRYPNDLVNTSLSRICVYENPSTPAYGGNTEKGWVEVDIYVTKEKDKIDRRVLLIADRIISLLDAKERSKVKKDSVMAGVGLYYYNRLPNMMTDRQEWKKYGLVFNYDLIKI